MFDFLKEIKTIINKYVLPSNWYLDIQIHKPFIKVRNPSILKHLKKNLIMSILTDLICTKTEKN